MDGVNKNFAFKSQLFLSYETDFYLRRNVWKKQSPGGI
jgi:hypothetical protein